MAILLETIAAPGATPIVNNGASEKAFVNNYYKLMDPGLSTRHRKAIMINGMIYVLALTGANYKTNHKGLRQDAEVYTSGISNLDVFAALAGTTVSTASAAPASMSLDVPTILAEVRDIVDMHELTQDRIIAFLGAQLGI